MIDDHHHDDEYHRGLAFDLGTLLARRRVLGLFAGLGAATLVGCSTDTPAASPTSAAASSATPGPSSAGATATGDAASCSEIPAETAGPFPGDGSNGPNVLTQSGIVRTDIRSSFGGPSGVAGGVPLTIKLAIVDTSKNCAPYAGAAVYIWQCSREGGYSLYTPGITGENYLRGVQAAGPDGVVTFLSVFPGAYSGRWPHAHFEVYPDLAATGAGKKIATSQLALPKAACDAVYATAGYAASVRNLTRTTLANDTVFRDGADRQLATMSGTIAAGLTATLSVPV